MQDFQKLLVWQRARTLALRIDAAAESFPVARATALQAQLTRAVHSISDNIAEGAGRATRPDFARFLSMAAASSNEVENQLIKAADRALIDHATVKDLTAATSEVRRMLFGLRKTVLAAEDEEVARRRKSKQKLKRKIRTAN